MSVKEDVSFNSSRVQRASRINTIEQSRLNNKLCMLEKQRVHSLRLANQDIRLITVTLEYIQSSSGQSPEGMAPRETSFAQSRSLSPCFLYGDRVGSRKYSRMRSQGMKDQESVTRPNSARNLHERGQGEKTKESEKTTIESSELDRTCLSKRREHSSTGIRNLTRTRSRSRLDIYKERREPRPLTAPGFLQKGATLVQTDTECHSKVLPKSQLKNTFLTEQMSGPISSAFMRSINSPTGHNKHTAEFRRKTARAFTVSLNQTRIEQVENRVKEFYDKYPIKRLYIAE